MLVWTNALFQRKSHTKQSFQNLSLWITARMWWTSEPLHVLCPLPLIFIFADSLLPKPLYHPFSWTYFWNMSQECLAPSITVVLLYECNRAQVVRYHRSMVLQSACTIQRNDKGRVKQRENNGTAILDMRERLSQLIIELCIADKEWDENAACHCFNFMQDCLASWHCIPIIKSLCIVNKDYLLQCLANAHDRLFWHHIRPQASHVETPWCLFLLAYVLMHLLNPWPDSICRSQVTNWRGFHRNNSPSTPSFFTRGLCFNWNTCHMYSHWGCCTPLMQKQRRNKAAEEELDPPGCLSN